MTTTCRRGWFTQIGPQTVRLAGRLLETCRRAATDLVFPPCCGYCGVSLDSSGDRIWLCETCRRNLSPQPGPFCLRCGSLLKQSAGAGDDCPACRGTSFRFDAVLPLGPYEKELRVAIIRMKHFHEQPLAAAMGRQIAERLGPYLKRHPADVVVPMPIHWLRRALRGTSSPEVMAETIGAQLQVNLAKGMLRCARSTKKQSLLSPRQRRRNVKGAFCVSPTYPPHGLHVVLIDDIVTTGATASEAAQTLRRAGAARVTVAVVARAAASGAPQTVSSAPPNRSNPRLLHAGHATTSNDAGKPQKAIRQKRIGL